MAQEPVFNPCGERVPVLGLNPWTRDLTPTTRGGGQPPGFYLVPDPFVPAIPDPLRSPDPVVPVASVKLKSLCPNPAGNTAAERALQWQNMTPEEKASKRNEMVRASHEMDPDLWQFLYLTRNLIKATQQIAEKLVDEGWMSGPEGDKWLDLHVALIMKDSAGAETLYEGGTIRAIGPARRSRLVFRVDQAKSTQFYRKVRVYADLFFLDPEDADTPPDDPGMPGEVDSDWGAMALEFGALAADEDLPPEDDGIELIEDDEERGKWTRVEIEPPPEDEEPEEEAPVDLGAGRALAHARATAAWAERAPADAKAAVAETTSPQPQPPAPPAARRLLLDQKAVERGRLLTFEAEGTDSETSGTFSRRAHVPGSWSGLTVGRGYDVKERSKDGVLADLTAAGVPKETAEKIAGGTGLKGEAAKKYRDESGLGGDTVLTREQQKKLFEIDYPRYEKEARKLYKKGAGPKDPDWDDLHPAIRATLTDLRFVGQSTKVSREKLAPFVKSNDVQGFAGAMSDEKFWVKSPPKGHNATAPDRFKRRVEYLKTVIESEGPKPPTIP